MVVFRMISGSSRSSGTTSSTNRGTMGGAGGGAKGVMAAFLALEKNLGKYQKYGLQFDCFYSLLNTTYHQISKENIVHLTLVRFSFLAGGRKNKCFYVLNCNFKSP